MAIVSQVVLIIEPPGFSTRCTSAIDFARSSGNMNPRQTVTVSTEAVGT